MADKLVTYTKIDKLLKAKQPPSPTPLTYEVDGEAIEIIVKKYIDFSSMMAFVNGVVNTVFFVDENGETHYVPAILEYAKALHYIEFYSNLKPDMGSDRVFALVYNTTILRDILKHISQPQYNHLEEAIDAAIEYRRNVLVSGEQSKIENAIEKIDQASMALQTLTNQFENVSEEKIRLVFDRLAEIDNKTLVENVIDIRDVK